MRLAPGRSVSSADRAQAGHCQAHGSGPIGPSHKRHQCSARPPHPAPASAASPTAQDQRPTETEFGLARSAYFGKAPALAPCH